MKHQSITPTVINNLCSLIAERMCQAFPLNVWMVVPAPGYEPSRGGIGLSVTTRPVNAVPAEPSDLGAKAWVLSDGNPPEVSPKSSTVITSGPIIADMLMDLNAEAERIAAWLVVEFAKHPGVLGLPVYYYAQVGGSYRATFYLTPKDYFDRFGVLASSRSDEAEPWLPESFHRVGDSTYTFDGATEDGISTLKRLGFQAPEHFVQFVLRTQGSPSSAERQLDELQLMALQLDSAHSAHGVHQRHTLVEACGDSKFSVLQITSNGSLRRVCTGTYEQAKLMLNTLMRALKVSSATDDHIADGLDDTLQKIETYLNACLSLEGNYKASVSLKQHRVGIGFQVIVKLTSPCTRCLTFTATCNLLDKDQLTGYAQRLYQEVARRTTLAVVGAV